MNRKTNGEPQPSMCEAEQSRAGLINRVNAPVFSRLSLLNSLGFADFVHESFCRLKSNLTLVELNRFHRPSSGVALYHNHYITPIKNLAHRAATRFGLIKLEAEG